MNNKNVRVIYKKIEPDFLNKFGYVNLNQREVNSKDDLVEISSIFRNPMYETFRIIYMKGNKIVGHEQISTKTPNAVKIFPVAKNGKMNTEKCFYKIRNRMKRLESDGYYMVHNHPSGNAKASNCDLKVTESFYEKINGFKGHLIVNLESYAWLDIDKYGRAVSSNYIPINNLKKDRFYKMMKKKSIYSMKILCRDDLVYLMHHIKNTQEYSTAILTDCMGKVRMILDIPNRFINMPPKELEGYFKNLSSLNGTSRVFFSTNDNEIYRKSLKHLEYGTFTDSICYKSEDNKIYIYEKADLVKDNNISTNIQLTNTVLTVKEDEEKYQKNISKSNENQNLEEKIEELNNTSLEFLDVPKGKIRILFKAVGQPAKIVTIPNTLQAKQRLVGGLIEVIQYEDVLLICNEEGKILNMPPNLVFDYDYIAGNCFIIGDDYENGNFRSLTLDEIEKYKKDIDSRSFKYKEVKENSSKEKDERFR